jgi:hypothetical protein
MPYSTSRGESSTANGGPSFLDTLDGKEIAVVRRHRLLRLIPPAPRSVEFCSWAAEPAILSERIQVRSETFFELQRHINVSKDTSYRFQSMKKIAIFAALLSMAGWAHAALKPGDSLSPYEVKNVSTGQEYCQVCAYGAKAGKIVAFGKLNDEAFWTDLKRLQGLQDAYKTLGVFAQVIDSKDTKAIKAAAAKHGVTFPVVVAVKKDWDKAYSVHGVSRTIYYAKQDNKITWTSELGLSDDSARELTAKLKKDLAS